jgi:5-hydroxyisourate hydrolase-like protein (transthyretin family)
MVRRIFLCILFSSGMMAQDMLAQEKIPVTMQRGEFQISGTVVDSLTEQPLANTRVAIAPVSQRDNFTTIVTNEDGRFRFQGLAAGKYTLTAQRRGYVTESFNQHEQYASSIVVGPDLDAGHLVLRLTAESVISGTVTDEHGDGVRDAQVMLFQQTLAGGSRSTRQRTTATTDEDGFYRFAHLPTGRYFVAVSAHPWYAQHFMPRNANGVSVAQGNFITTTYGSIAGVMGNTPPQEPVVESRSPLDVSFPLTFYPGVTDASSAGAILVGKGEKVSADVVLAAVPAVHFRVDTGSPGQQTGAPEQQQGSSIRLEQKLFDGAAIPVYTQYMAVEPGVMEIVGVIPGRYNIKINSWGGGKTQALQEREVDLSERGDLDASTNKTTVPLTAEVSFESPAARDQLWVVVRDKKSSKILQENVNDKGEAEFKQGVLPGIYEVSFQSAKQIFIKNLSASGARVTGRTLEIKGSGPVKLTMTAVQGEGEVSGMALSDGKGVAGAMVVLVPDDPANNRVLFRRDQSDSDGTFALASVVPGRYTLLAIENGWDLEWANPEILRKFTARGESVTVVPNGKYSVKVKVQ